MGYAAGLAVAVGLFWIGLSGNLDPISLAYGLAAIVIAIFIAARIQALDSEGVPYWRVLGLARYSLWLLVQLAKANVSTVLRVLSPGTTISPTLIRFRTRTPLDMTRVVLANSITLMPGAIVIDVEDDALLIHVLDERAVSSDDFQGLERRVIRAMGGTKGP